MVLRCKFKNFDVNFLLKILIAEEKILNVGENCHQHFDRNSVSFTRVFLFSYYFDQSWIKAGTDGAAAVNPPLYQINEVIKVIDTITFKN